MNRRTCRRRTCLAAAAAACVLLNVSVAAHAQLAPGLTTGSTLSPAVTASLDLHVDPPYATDAFLPLPGLPHHASVRLQERDTAGTGRLIAGGITGGLLGMVVGGAVGGGLEVTLSRNCFDYCGLGGILLGGVIGESLGMAFGVHAANRRRGSYGAAVVGPLGVVVGSLALGMLMDSADIPPPLVYLGVPALQLFTSIAGERAAERRRAGPPE